ncbi:MAG: Flp pilus assembly complex ATPase component TadA [Candidatus Omnitrophica bacterium]|nr:Flp pilus assembly complex ATPase component TadA [Candidatus Omnitrophota bacterium]
MAQTIVLFSTKGGVGKSLIASNVAVALAQDERRKVCLVDLDLQGVGDMSRMMGIKPHRAMVDLMPVLKKQPEQAQIQTVLNRSPMGIDFLPGVHRPQQAPHCDPSKIRNVFELLNKNYHYIVVDAGRAFSELFAATLNQANLILMVVTPDILSIYQTKWALDTLQFLHLPLSMIRIILNRAESVSSISLQDVSSSLPVQVLAALPSEGKVAGLAINRGIPVIVDTPKSKLSAGLKKLAHDLATMENLYLPHREIDQLQLREVTGGLGSGWQSLGLSEGVGVEEAQREAHDEIVLLKRRIQNRLIDELNLKRVDMKIFADPQQSKELRDKAEISVSNLLAEEASSFISSSEIRRKLVKEILDEALGLGPLEDLLADQSITDILVNNKDHIYVEREGRLELSSKKFMNDNQVRICIERIIAPLGRRIDESVPMVDARLADGSRVNAIIPPLSLTGPTIAVRKFRKEKFKVHDLISLNTLSQHMGEFLKACVLARKNVIVSGGTGSGKTTDLNVLSEFIPDSERIITIEDAAEIKLHQEHWVRLEARPPNIEGKGAITVRDLFRNTLRMRPDRIIIGECRGLEALDMLQAMNTGHDGSMTTLHANSTHDVLSRLDSMVLMSAVELPVRAIREMIASAINLIVHTARLTDGSRKVLQITEVAGMRDDLHINLRDIFSFRQTGADDRGKITGEFVATGYLPSFLEDIRVRNIPLSEDVFKTG